MVSFVLLAYAARDHIHIGLRLLVRDSRFEPDRHVIVLVAAPPDSIRAQRQWQINVDYIGSPDGLHDFVIQLELFSERARYRVLLAIQRDALPNNVRVRAE